jgi:pentatricopeptide repeat protein
VSVYGKAGLVGPAEAAFQVAERMGEASIRVHNALVDVYLRAGLYQEAEAWYKKMEEAGLEADEATCRTYLVRLVGLRAWG